MKLSNSLLPTWHTLTTLEQRALTSHALELAESGCPCCDDQRAAEHVWIYLRRRQLQLNVTPWRQRVAETARVVRESCAAKPAGDVALRFEAEYTRFENVWGESCEKQETLDRRAWSQVSESAGQADEA